MVGRVVPLTTSEQIAAPAAEAFLSSRAWPHPPVAPLTTPPPAGPRARPRPAAVDAHRGGDHGRGDDRLGWTGAGDLEPPGGHRPLVSGVLPPAARLVEDRTVDLERRPEPADRTKAIPLPELEGLW